MVSQVVLTAPALNSDARAVMVDAHHEVALAQQAQNEPNMTNADRAELGLSLRDTEPTPAPVPDSFPIVTIDTSKRLRHALRWSDNKTPTSRARPEGMDYAEIWLYIGLLPPQAPASSSSLTPPRRPLSTTSTPKPTRARPPTSSSAGLTRAATKALGAKPSAPPSPAE